MLFHKMYTMSIYSMVISIKYFLAQKECPLPTSRQTFAAQTNTSRAFHVFFFLYVDRFQQLCDVPLDLKLAYLERSALVKVEEYSTHEDNLYKTAGNTLCFVWCLAAVATPIHLSNCSNLASAG